LAARNVVTWSPPLQVQSFLDANREVKPAAVDGAAAAEAGTVGSMAEAMKTRIVNDSRRFTGPNAHR
jgi:hypothetical protein